MTGLDESKLGKLNAKEPDWAEHPAVNSLGIGTAPHEVQDPFTPSPNKGHANSGTDRFLLARTYCDRFIRSAWITGFTFRLATYKYHAEK